MKTATLKEVAPAQAAGSSTQSFDTGNVLYSRLRPYLYKVVCPDSPGIATMELVPLRPDPKKLDAADALRTKRRESLALFAALQHQAFRGEL